MKKPPGIPAAFLELHRRTTNTTALIDDTMALPFFCGFGLKSTNTGLSPIVIHAARENGTMFEASGSVSMGLVMVRANWGMQWR